jgi:hypothetical protein
MSDWMGEHTWKLLKAAGERRDRQRLMYLKMLRILLFLFVSSLVIGFLAVWSRVPEKQEVVPLPAERVLE